MFWQDVLAYARGRTQRMEEAEENGEDGKGEKAMCDQLTSDKFEYTLSARRIVCMPMSSGSAESTRSE